MAILGIWSIVEPKYFCILVTLPGLQEDVTGS